MINASWDLLEILFIIFFWVETSNKTLEEIDELIDGEMHSDAPALMAVIKGDAEVKAGLEIKGMNINPDVLDAVEIDGVEELNVPTKK